MLDFCFWIEGLGLINFAHFLVVALPIIPLDRPVASFIQHFLQYQEVTWEGDAADTFT